MPYTIQPTVMYVPGVGQTTVYGMNVISNLIQPDGSLVSTLQAFDNSNNSLGTWQQSTLSAPQLVAFNNTGGNIANASSLLAAAGFQF